MFCSKCGKQIADGSRFCPECGAKTEMSAAQPNTAQNSWAGTRDQTSPTDMVYPKNPPKSPHVAWWCLLWPGIGQIVLGQAAKGIVLMVVAFVLNLVLPVINFVLIPVAIIDAYKVGNRLASGKPVRKWDWFPA